MKQNFEMVKIVLLILLVWCGLVTDAQNNGTRSTSNSSMTTTAQPSTEPMDDSSWKLDLIIGCVVADGFITLIAITCVCVWLIRRRHELSIRVLNICAPPSYSCYHSHSPRSSSRLIVRVDDDVFNVAKRLKPEACPDRVEEIITTNGGVITVHNFTLTIGPGCLQEDTKISLKKDNQYIASICNSLCDLGLLDAIPQVVRFSPDGLKFLKAADLAITIEPMPHKRDSEHFILRGSYNPRCQRTVWEVVTNGIEQKNVEGILRAKINSFSFYSYILAKRGTLARILSHLNHSFTCRAYAFYRRLPAMDTIDISAVLVSEFVDENLGEDIRQIKDHVEAGYVKEDKGFLKPVRTNCPLEMCLYFADVVNVPFSFKIDQRQLDSAVGFVVDHFRRIAIRNPAIGTVMIDEVQEETERKSLWVLNISENGDLKIAREFADDRKG